MDKIRFPYAKFFLEANEKWLNEQKNSGLRLKKISGHHAVWEQGEERVTYHIDSSGKNVSSMLSNTGWEPVCSYGCGMTVYASKAKDPKVPIPEKGDEKCLEELRVSVKKLQGRNLWLAMIGVFLFLLVEMTGLSYYFHREAMILLNDWLILFFIAVFVLTVLNLIHYARRERGIRQWAEHRIEEQTDDFYARIKVRNVKTEWPETDGFMKPSAFIGSIALGLTLIAMMISLGTIHHGELKDLNDGYVALSSLESGTFHPQAFENFENTYVTKRSFSVPYQRTIRQGGADGEMTSIVMRTEEYRTRSEKRAKELLEACIQKETGWNTIMDPEELEVSGVDEAYYTGYQSLQYLFLRQGEKVAVVYYIGSVQLDEKAEAFVPLLTTGVNDR